MKLRKNMKLPHLAKRILHMATYLCLLLLTHHAKANCEPSINVVETSPGVKEGTMISKDCEKTDTVHDENKGEHRLRSTTIKGEVTRGYLGPDEAKIDYKGGEYGQFGGEWPDDEWTQRIPKPDFVLHAATVNKKAHSFSAVFKINAQGGNITPVKIKSYVSKLKARGFTISANEHESPEKPDMPEYHSYRAKNSAGYFVDFHCSVAISCGLALYNPTGTKKKEKREAESN